MGVEKFSVSFDSELGRAIREAAAGSESSVSSWLAEAAAARLRCEALGAAVRTWEERFGALSEEEIVAAERVLDGPARPVRRRPTKRAAG